MFGLSALIMGLQPMELVVIALVLVVLFGARRIPELARGVADGIKTFKKTMKDDDEEKPKTT
jgi:sec-independent protein translocase protein TatA